MTTMTDASTEGAHILYRPDAWIRLVDSAGRTVTTARRYLARAGLPAGWYSEDVFPHTLAQYIGTEDAAKNTLAMRGATLAIAELLNGQTR